MVKILRLHLSAQYALREITILNNFAIGKGEKNISLQRFRDLKIVSKKRLARRWKWIKSQKNRKNVYKAKFLTPSPQIFRVLLDPVV
jgi:hypothetical protein